MLPESLTLVLEHCGQPMRNKRSGARWQGDFEVTDADYACRDCDFTVNVTARENVGPPDGA